MTDKQERINRDVNLVDACLRGDVAAWSHLRAGLHEPLRAILVGRGATRTEAADLLGDLWADCLLAANPVEGNGQNPSGLLRKYHGRCALLTWLAAVATHRLVDLKRRQKFLGELPGAESRRTAERGDVASSSADPFGALPAPAPERAPTDAPLLELMRRALTGALAQRSAEERVMLRLVFLEKISQRTVARMWGWNDSKISRALDGAMRRIRTDTLVEIKAADPWLELSWTDFLELCEGSDGTPWF